MLNEPRPDLDAPVDDAQPVVGSPEDLALPAHGQVCGVCGRPRHTACGPWSS